MFDESRLEAPIVFYLIWREDVLASCVVGNLVCGGRQDIIQCSLLALLKFHDIETNQIWSSNSGA